MWWHGPEGGHMYGWWFMPLFGIFCMIIFLYAISRIFGRGSCGGSHPTESQQSVDDLVQEVLELRSEIRALKEGKESKEAPL